MNLNETKNEIHERSKYYLEKDKSGKDIYVLFVVWLRTEILMLLKISII